MAKVEEKIKIFGTDGVRGRANIMPMTVEVALALGRAAGKIFRRHSGKHRVVVGKDTRLSCYMFENALISGLCSMGVDTLMLGPFPTPGVAFITRAYRADAGIVISASHNPYYDNGIKFFSSEGFKLQDSIEDEMEELVYKNAFDDCLPKDDDIGRNTRVHDADGRYTEFAKSTFPKHMTLNGMKIALDCSHGAAYRIAPHVFWELGADVFSYGIEPDGININKGCGSLHLELIQKRVIDHHAHVGIAFDGDGDRVILIDELAQIVDGDMILGIIAQYMNEKGILKNNRVVGTVMSNFGFVKALEELGIEVILSQVGDRYVIQDMIDHEAILGGEQSGHIICLDHNTTGDALIASLQVLTIMIEKDMPLSQLAQVVKKYPQALINVKVSSKPKLETLKNVQIAIKSVEKDLGDSGRVLVRYSGTENICRVMVEGPVSKTVDQFAKKIAQAVEDAIGGS
ncbi:MAG: Phosphoglucosamine mutase [Chlamydiae bacterium]|nr:Phosphoglucosamine mutase [Chlamydiota bacterium]